ncbi:integrase catalytic domain-containing protein, partial [Trichonephila clavata]
MEGAGALETNEMLSITLAEKTKTLNRRRGSYKAKITKLQSFLKDKASNAEQLLLQSKLDKVSEMYSSMEALKIEYYEVVEDEQLPNLELILEEMEDDLEEIKGPPLKLKTPFLSKGKSFIVKSNNNNNCLLCKTSHRLYDCTLFLKMNPLQRFNLIKKHGLCINCLNNNHKVALCKSKYTCRLCRGKHNYLLCRSENGQSDTEGSSSNTLFTQPAPSVAPNTSPNNGGVINNPTEPQTVQKFSSLNQRGNKLVFLSTAIVGVWSPLLKSYVGGRVILDSASQSHFMTLQFASKLGLEKKKINLAVSGLSENSTNIKWKINDAFISNNDSSYTSPLDFLIVPRITDFVPSIQSNLKIKRFNDINRSILADPSFDKPGKIDMIIGVELFYQILKDGRK